MKLSYAVLKDVVQLTPNFNICNCESTLNLHLLYFVVISLAIEGYHVNACERSIPKIKNKGQA